MPFCTAILLLQKINLRLKKRKASFNYIIFIARKNIKNFYLSSREDKSLMTAL